MDFPGGGPGPVFDDFWGFKFLSYQSIKFLINHF
jgi:hypothetical protein